MVAYDFTQCIVCCAVFTRPIFSAAYLEGKMGISMSNVYTEGNKPDVQPDSFSAPTFPPDYGFKVPRKKRESKISEEEMRALKINKEQRDYCAHIWKDYMVCRKQYRPLFGMCYPERHAYQHCQIEDSTYRVKEYERERRLRERAARKAAAAAS